MSEPSYSTVVSHLAKAAVPVRELRGGGTGAEGAVAVTLAAGRIIALAFSSDSPNLLWSNPQLGDAELIKNHAERLIGGFGGDRLWFAPELAFHWEGRPDWHTFNNYKVPAATDPGDYHFVGEVADCITLHAAGELSILATDQCVGFEVNRSVRLTPSPLASTDPLMRGVEYIGIETSHVLRMTDSTRTGQIDLWQVLQIPVGSVLLVPLRKDTSREQAKPLPYAMTANWDIRADHILWYYGGVSRSTFGLSATASTGRSGVLRMLAPRRWSLIVREFPVNRSGRYGDHPHGIPRDDQVFQAWDGYGFGEMEYHSPILDAELGPRSIEQFDRLWAFGGNRRAIAQLAQRLLEIDAQHAFAIVDAH